MHALAIVSLVLGGACAVWIAFDETRHPQHMAIMNFVWPLTALFGSVLVLWQYHTYGRSGAREGSFGIKVANGALHCGAGCTLGDIVAEWLVFAVPAIAVFFGWHTIFGERMFAVWIVDYLFAYAFGIVFQYFSIAPMRGLGFRDGLVAAIKADTLSLTAWQVGMYGFMAIVRYAITGAPLGTDTPEFWFAMQIAMLCGFATAYPVNWWLLKAGIKEPM
jgi:hypothetical protein